MDKTKTDPLLGEQLDLLWRIMRRNADGLAALRLFRTVLQSLLGDCPDKDMAPILARLVKTEQSLSAVHEDVARLITLSGQWLDEDTRTQTRQAAILRKLATESQEGAVAFAESASDNGTLTVETDISDTLPPPPRPKPGK